MCSLLGISVTNFAILVNYVAEVTKLDKTRNLSFFSLASLPFIRIQQVKTHTHVCVKRVIKTWQRESCPSLSCPVYFRFTFFTYRRFFCSESFDFS